MTYMKKILLISLLFFVASLPAKQAYVSILDKLNPDSVRVLSNEKAAEYLLQKYRNKENLYLCADAANIENIRKTFPEEVKTSIEVANQVRQQYFLFRYDWDMEKTNVPYQF